MAGHRHPLYNGERLESPMAIRRPGALGQVRPRWLVPGLALLALAGVGIGLTVQEQQRRQTEQARHSQPLPRRIAALGRVEPLDFTR